MLSVNNAYSLYAYGVWVLYVTGRVTVWPLCLGLQGKCLDAIFGDNVDEKIQYKGLVS